MVVSFYSLRGQYFKPFIFPLSTLVFWFLEAALCIDKDEGFICSPAEGCLKLFLAGSRNHHRDAEKKKDRGIKNE